MTYDIETLASKCLSVRNTTNIYVNGATQQLLNELRNGLIDSSASGSFSTINSAAG